ncbi:hypothetical protein [Pseudomonas sp. nanlin1]
MFAHEYIGLSILDAVLLLNLVLVGLFALQRLGRLRGIGKASNRRRFDAA